MRWRIIFVIALAVVLPATGMSQPPNGQPFSALQLQIDQINSKLNALLGQSCPEGQFVIGFTSTGTLICGNHTPPTTTTYIMVCDKCSGDIGLCGTDPFDESHANYRLVFQVGFAGSITAVGVEISSAGGTPARLELRDATTDNVLATSQDAATSSTGWIEFTFSPAYVIDRTSLVMNFVADGGARMYNCANTVQFTPAGLTAYGLGLEGHLARSYIKISY